MIFNANGGGFKSDFFLFLPSGILPRNVTPGERSFLTLGFICMVFRRPIRAEDHDAFAAVGSAYGEL